MNKSTTESPSEKPKPRALLDIVADLRVALDAAEGEVDAAVDALQMEFSDKVEAYAIIIREQAARQVANGTLARHYAAAAEVHGNAQKRTKERLDVCMKLSNTVDIRTATAHVYYKTTEAVEITSLPELKAQFPLESHPEYWRTSEPEPDKAALKLRISSNPTAIVDGVKSIPGAQIVTNKTLQLK